ncbi:MAG: mandelate racemase/muconate lactonizing enzyme family protein [Dehalococcoidales bacterium]
MKITGIECVPLSVPTPMRGEGTAGNILLVKLHTDEGLTGIADAGGVNQDIVVSMIKTWEPILIGADPLDKGLIMAKLSRSISSVWGVSYPAAVATIDFALWDLAGKALNQPIYQLLGGKAVDKLLFNFFIHTENSPDGPRKAAEEAVKAMADGVKSVGVKSTGFGGGTRSLERDVEIVGAIRKAVGDKMGISFDANAGYNYHDALMMGRAMDEFNLFKYEQLCWDVNGLAQLRSKLNTPICAHESSVLIPGLIEVIEKKAADIVGTKLASSGGITEGLKWANVAKAAGIAMYCGAMNGPWEAAAQAHWLCSDAEFGTQDHDVFMPVLMYNTFDTTKITNGMDLIKNPQVYKDGYFYPPEGPGIGLELNEEAVPKYITKGKSIVTFGQKAGSSKSPVAMGEKEKVPA